MSRARMIAVLSLLVACQATSAAPANSSTPAAGASPAAASPPAASATPPAASTSTTVCNDYLTCVSATDASELPPLLAAYGKNGDCWQAGNDALCAQACWAGLHANRVAYPDAGSVCPNCLTDADCADTLGATACDTAHAECVECTSDANCPGGACDTSTQQCVACVDNSQCSGATPACSDHKCVACTADTQCSGSTPACDTTTNTCVACTSNAQCGGSSVCTTEETCCQPDTCDAIRQSPGGRQQLCDSPYDVTCQTQVSCGSCSVGTCIQNACSSAGEPCTPPGQSTCALGEICTFVTTSANTGAYECSRDYTGVPCVYPDDNGDQCADLGPSGNMVHDGFDCGTNNVCQQTCQQSSECLGSHSCKLFMGLTWGVCD